MNLMKSVAVCGVLAICAVPLLRASDDETDDVQLEIKAPLQAVNCAGTPPTVTLLGLTIAVTPGSFDDSSASSRTNGADDGGASDAANCASLVVGQFVEVKLIGTSAPLVANAVEAKAAADIQIKGRIENIDASAQTITVLGMTIQIAGARLDGSDDSGGDDNGGIDDTPIAIGNLAIGQFVEVTLNSAVLPVLSALEVDVQNFSNQISLSFEDRDDSLENDDDLVEIEIEHGVTVREPKPTGQGTRRVKKLFSYHFSTNANTPITLPGFATGTAKVTVTRTSDGATGKRNVRVKGNQIAVGKIKLKAPRR